MLNQQKSNDKTQLLLALRPFLKPSRQEKVDHAMKLMKLTGVLSVMRDMQGD